jgi:hypothetical protein
MASIFSWSACIIASSLWFSILAWWIFIRETRVPRRTSNFSLLALICLLSFRPSSWQAGVPLFVPSVAPFLWFGAVTAQCNPQSNPTSDTSYHMYEVTIHGIRIGNRIYWILTTRNCKWGICSHCSTHFTNHYRTHYSGRLLLECYALCAISHRSLLLHPLPLPLLGLPYLLLPFL